MKRYLPFLPFILFIILLLGFGAVQDVGAQEPTPTATPTLPYCDEIEEFQTPTSVFPTADIATPEPFETPDPLATPSATLEAFPTPPSVTETPTVVPTPSDHAWTDFRITAGGCNGVSTWSCDYTDGGQRTIFCSGGVVGSDDNQYTECAIEFYVIAKLSNPWINDGYYWKWENMSANLLEVNQSIYGGTSLEGFQPFQSGSWQARHYAYSIGSGASYQGPWSLSGELTLSVDPIEEEEPPEEECQEREPCCHLEPPWFEDGACYVFMPGGTVDLPNSSFSIFGIEITMLEGLPASVTFPGYELCTRYLHFSAGFMGFEFEEIAATMTFILALGLAYGEIRK